ncbi:MAG: transglutaminase domain-containing protein [Lachnospiraceae bacterium]|nr:transglutaminase domain-containing protein [Lachnospiraceae bacterium]
MKNKVGKMSKRIIFLLLSVIGVLNLSGCGRSDEVLNETAETEDILAFDMNTEVESLPIEEAEGNEETGKVEVLLENEVEIQIDLSDKAEEKQGYLKQSNTPAITVPEDKTYFGLNYMYGTEFYGHELYEFDDDLTRGSVSLVNLSRYSTNTLDYEAYYGIHTYIENDDVYVKAYNHSTEHEIISSVIMSDMGDTKELPINYNDYIVIDRDELDYGLYNIIVEFDTNVVDLYIFVAENGVYTCRNTKHFSGVKHIDKVIERKEVLNNLFEKYGIEPEECLSVEEIYYPCLNEQGGRCDTQRWAQLSHELIVGNTQWSDEFKVFVYVEWMNNNIAYDKWRSNNGSSRAKYYNIWDGTYSMWDTKIGVCCDFSNVLVIMLREQGIPATTLENDGHMWVAVYLDGEWREFDPTTMLQYSTYELDKYSKDDFVKGLKDFTDYGTFDCDKLFYIGEDLWTYDRIINGRIIDIQMDE